MNVLAFTVKPVSSECSMRCRYCLFADKAENRGRMTLETLDALVKKALAEAEEGVSFVFSGGEPTLAGLGFFRSLVAFEETHNTRKIPVAHALVTNGLAIDGEWVEFLRKHNFVVSVSIDADKKTHDALRPDREGKDTHNRAVPAARLLAEGGVEHNILSVLTRPVAAHPDSAYRYFRDRAFGFVHFVPVLSAPDDLALDNDVYAKFLCRFFDLWHRDFTGGDYLSVRDFDRYVHILAGHPPEDTFVLGSNLVVEADGGVYPCEGYAGDANRMGNITADSVAALLESPAAKAFLAASTDAGERADLGADSKLLYEGNPAGVDPVLGARIPLKEFAEAYKQFFAYARPRLEFLAKRLFTDSL